MVRSHIISLSPSKASGRSKPATCATSRKDGRRSGGGKYNETALKAAERAKTKWTRIASDQELKCYRIFGPGQEFPDPVWPKTTLLDLMRKAFGDGYLVKDANHPLVRRIQGLAK